MHPEGVKCVQHGQGGSWVSHSPNFSWRRRSISSSSVSLVLDRAEI